MAKKKAAKKASGKRKQKQSRAARTHTRGRTVRQARARPRRPSASPYSFATTYLWLVLLDGFISLLRLIGGVFFLAGPALTSIEAASGLYGAFVFLLSIIVIVIFARQRQPKALLAVPIYVVAAPLILLALATLLGGAEGTNPIMVILTWIAVIIEIILAAVQLNEKRRGW